MLAVAQSSAQRITFTLTLSDHNGYNVSCYGAQDASIDLSVTGGTPPYSYEWSNAATPQDVGDLEAGYYHVRIRIRTGYPSKRRSHSRSPSSSPWPLFRTSTRTATA